MKNIHKKSNDNVKKIINKGYGAIRKEAQDWLKEHTNNLMGDDAEKCMFYSYYKCSKQWKRLA